jgi:tRNA (adenine-N(1)-)-methyltransferase non-catalytic subunit
MTGGQLISKLIENSETFQKRTKFSQEKYLRKKMQKYQVSFEVKKPTALELCETYSQQAPNKILNLRPDSLGLIL